MTASGMQSNLSAGTDTAFIVVGEGSPKSACDGLHLSFFLNHVQCMHQELAVGYVNVRVCEQKSDGTAADREATLLDRTE